MNTDDRDLRVRLQMLDDLEARLVRQERTSQTIVIMVTTLGTVTLIVLGYLVTRA